MSNGPVGSKAWLAENKPPPLKKKPKGHIHTSYIEKVGNSQYKWKQDTGHFSVDSIDEPVMVDANGSVGRRRKK